MATAPQSSVQQRWARAPFYFNSAAHLLRISREMAMNLQELLETVRRELIDIVKLDARPMFARLYRWRGAMAQYEPGHISRVARIEACVREIAGLALAGNAYHGIGVPDCVRSGMEAAKALVSAQEPQPTRP